MRSSRELRKWKLRKMKTAGIDLEEEYSDDAQDVIDLVYTGRRPGFVEDGSTTILRNSVSLYKPNTEIMEVARRRSMYLEKHPRAAISHSLGGVEQEIEMGDLPIHKHRAELIEFIARNQVSVVVGETGSGKSTQIPQYLFHEGYGRRGLIGCTQPRRVAAASLAAALKGVLGRKVGYTVRFDDATTEETVIRYMTEGILLRELSEDKLLRRYSVVIFDEAHERSANADLCFGLIRQLLDKRRDLKVIVMSATMQASKLCSFFRCPAFGIEGRCYPVKISYLKVNVDDYVEWIVKKVMAIHVNEEDGDILVFVTGKDDVEGIVGILNFCIQEESKGPCGREGPRRLAALKTFPLYSQLSNPQQEMVFKGEPGTRKCIVSTNVAETSVTIPNIRYVVDSGLQKTSFYEYGTGESLVLCPISKASANQRSGRAGRTRPGMCYRMYTRETYENEFLEDAVPEIQRADICNVVLLLLHHGIKDVCAFGFVDSPPKALIQNALHLLHCLRAIDAECNITETGLEMLDMRMDPLLCRMVLESIKFGCVEEMVAIAGMLSVDLVPLKPACGADCDFIALLDLFREFVRHGNKEEWCRELNVNIRMFRRACDIVRTMRATLIRRNIRLTSSGSIERIKRCLVSALYLNVAKQKNRGYVCLSSFLSCIKHPTSTIGAPEYLVFYKLITTKREYAYCCSSIDPQWVLEEAPGLYKDRRRHATRAIKSSEAERHTERSVGNGAEYTFFNEIRLDKDLYERFEKHNSSGESEEELNVERRRTSARF
jgi:pre-mRNA-splicing factor ATP-dependent RNA helicase DHX38/PRP16